MICCGRVVRRLLQGQPEWSMNKIVRRRVVLQSERRWGEKDSLLARGDFVHVGVDMFGLSQGRRSSEPGIRIFTIVLARICADCGAHEFVLFGVVGTGSGLT